MLANAILPLLLQVMLRLFTSLHMKCPEVCNGNFLNTQMPNSLLYTCTAIPQAGCAPACPDVQLMQAHLLL
jgi:hypothetical protein